MAKFIPEKTFDAYPDGKTKVRFRAGVESDDYPAEFVRLMVAKGLGKKAKPEKRSDDDE